MCGAGRTGLRDSHASSSAGGAESSPCSSTPTTSSITATPTLETRPIKTGAKSKEPKSGSRLSSRGALATDKRAPSQNLSQNFGADGEGCLSGFSVRCVA